MKKLIPHKKKCETCECLNRAIEIAENEKALRAEIKTAFTKVISSLLQMEGLVNGLTD